MGGKVDEVAKVAIGGAIEAAGSIGNTAVKAVRDALIGVAEGTKDVLVAVLPKPRSSQIPRLPQTPRPPQTARQTQSPEAPRKKT
jgi:hypothetical protein